MVGEFVNISNVLIGDVTLYYLNDLIGDLLPKTKDIKLDSAWKRNYFPRGHYFFSYNNSVNQYDNEQTNSNWKMPSQ
jgi:hypothetical protein